MSASANLTKLKTYKDVVEKFEAYLIDMSLFGFKTLDYVTITEGNKGRRTITEGLVSDITYEWVKSFNPVEDAFDYKPRHIDVRAQKIDLQFVPQEYEGTYLGEQRKKGQNPGKDLPQEAWHLMKILSKLKNELETAVWQGEIGVVPTDGSLRKLRKNLKGFLNIIKEELALSSPSFSPMATPNGAWTSDNTVEGINNLYSRLDTDVQGQPCVAFAAKHVVKKYKDNYFKLYKNRIDENMLNDGIPLDDGDCKLIWVPGMGTSNRVIITPVENMFIDFDDQGDLERINMELNKRAVDLWMDYKVGTQIGIIDTKILSVNDLE